ncbi:MAG: polymer-forming cytoskeletal protein [Crenarchaeota archaeon]|nr:polymer-forming cytoskeletal protein [Thermoproteota archaeon]
MEIMKARISVGGVLDVNGSIEVDTIRVGGTTTVKGSVKAKDVVIGGRLKVDENASIEAMLEVGGVAKIGGELKAGVVKVGGDLEADVCFADSIEVGGRIETKRGLKAKTFKIGRHGEVVGPIVAENVKIGRGASVEDIYANWLELGENSSARNVYAREAYLKRGCRVAGELLYVDKLEFEENVEMYSESKKVEKLPEPPI